MIGEREGLPTQGVRDGFKPSDAWPALGASVEMPIEAGSPADLFRSNHELNAVIAGAGRGYALIDDRTLFVGQKLDGFELVEVGARSAVFEADGVRVRLTLSGPESDG